MVVVAELEETWEDARVFEKKKISSLVGYQVLFPLAELRGEVGERHLTVAIHNGW